MRSASLQLALVFACACVPALAATAVHDAPRSTANLPDAPTPAEGKSDGNLNASVARGTSKAIERPQAAWQVTATPVNEPLKWRKTSYFLESTYSFRNFLDAGFLAGIPNIPSAPVQPTAPTVFDHDTMTRYEDAMTAYGHGMDNWRRSSEDELRYRAHRLEVGLAASETRNVVGNLVLPLALRQKAQYVPASFDQGFGGRMGHALLSSVVTYNDAGRVVPNYSKWGGIVAAAFLAKNVYADQLDAPELNSNHFVGRYIAYSVAGDVATNLGRELVRNATRDDIENYMNQGRPTEDAYYSLSFGGKFITWARSAYAPRNFIQGALIAGYPNVDDMPELPPEPVITNDAELLAYNKKLTAYGNAAQLWRDTTEEDVRYHERRLIGGFSASETQQFLSNFLVPVVARMDPRYIALGSDHSGGARLGHALMGVGVGHMDSGHRMVNLPVLVGTVGAAFIAQKAYYPTLNTPNLESNSVLARTIGFNLAADAIFNVMGEFLHRSR